MFNPATLGQASQITAIFAQAKLSKEECQLLINSGLISALIERFSYHDLSDDDPKINSKLKKMLATTRRALGLPPDEGSSNESIIIKIPNSPIRPDMGIIEYLFVGGVYDRNIIYNRDLMSFSNLASEQFVKAKKDADSLGLDWGKELRRDYVIYDPGHFDTPITDLGVSRDIERQGLGLGSLLDLLILGVTRPDLALSFDIVAPGSFWDEPPRNGLLGCTMGFYIGRDGWNKTIGLTSSVITTPSCLKKIRFLAVKPEKEEQIQA